MKRIDRIVIPVIGIVAVAVGVLAWRAGLFGLHSASADTSMEFIGATPTDETRLRDVLVLSGFLEQQGEYVAIVNKNVVKLGEEIEVLAGKHPYRLRVELIEMERVVLRVLEGPD